MRHQRFVSFASVVTLVVALGIFPTMAAAADLDSDGVEDNIDQCITPGLDPATSVVELDRRSPSVGCPQEWGSCNLFRLLVGQSGSACGARPAGHSWNSASYGPLLWRVASREGHDGSRHDFGNFPMVFAGGKWTVTSGYVYRDGRVYDSSGADLGLSYLDASTPPVAHTRARVRTSNPASATPGGGSRSATSSSTTRRAPAWLAPLEDRTVDTNGDGVVNEQDLTRRQREDLRDDDQDARHYDRTVDTNGDGVIDEDDQTWRQRQGDRDDAQDARHYDRTVDTNGDGVIDENDQTRREREDARDDGQDARMDRGDARHYDRTVDTNGDGVINDDDLTWRQRNDSADFRQDQERESDQAEHYDRQFDTNGDGVIDEDDQTWRERTSEDIDLLGRSEMWFAGTLSYRGHQIHGSQPVNGGFSLINVDRAFSLGVAGGWQSYREGLGLFRFGGGVAVTSNHLGVDGHLDAVLAAQLPASGTAKSWLSIGVLLRGNVGRANLVPDEEWGQGFDDGAYAGFEAMGVLYARFAKGFEALAGCGFSGAHYFLPGEDQFSPSLACTAQVGTRFGLNAKNRGGEARANR